MWNQVYNPFNNSVFSTVAAALPVVTLLVLIASNKVKAHIAAVIALIVATGSDTSSNILFGNLQKITSEQLGLSPILMGAANSSGGVMGKMIDAQSIVVASTATN